MNNNVIALILLLGSAFMNSLLTVLIEYLESRNVTWVQTFLFAEWVDVILLTIFWLLLFSYNFYALKTSESNEYGNFFYYLCSIFPSIKCEIYSMQQWCVLIGRTFFGILTYACYNVSILYCDSGNVILIETVLTSVGNLILGKLLFGESLNYVIYISLFICIIGLVLVVQPSFLFDTIYANNNIDTNNDSNNDSVNDNGDGYQPISLIGFIFMFLAGAGRAGYNALIKKTQYIKLSSMTAMLVPEMLAGVFILIFYIVGSIYWDWQFIDDTNVNLSTEHSANNLLLLVSLGALLFLWVITATIGFRIGEMGRLGIINNTDIVMTYLLQIGILDETDNWLCYLGAGFVCLGCVIIFWEQSRRVYSSNGGSYSESSRNGSQSITATGSRSDSIGFGKGKRGSKTDLLVYTPIAGSCNENDENYYYDSDNKEQINEQTSLI